MTTEAHRRVHDLALRQHGVLSYEQGRVCGLSHSAISRAVRRGTLTRIHRGVLAIAPTSELTVAAELTAARLAARGGTIAGHSAAILWNLEGAQHRAPELILEPDDTREQRPGLRLSWRALAPEDVTDVAGFPTTTIARTLIDLARREAPVAVLPLVDSALRLGTLRASDLASLAAISRRGRRVFELADGRAESVFESIVRYDLIAAGLTPEALQYEIRDARGNLVARVDMAWPSCGLLVELDGFATHGTPAALSSDLRRQNALVAAGWTVLRFAWSDRNRIVHAVRSAVDLGANSARRRVTPPGYARPAELSSGF